eukprot:1726493-Pleurochrysis_carterae.AAC.6
MISVMKRASGHRTFINHTSEQNMLPMAVYGSRITWLLVKIELRLGHTNKGMASEESATKSDAPSTSQHMTCCAFWRTSKLAMPTGNAAASAVM